MPTLYLVQGPAGGGKSQHVREMLLAGEAAIVADLTRNWAAVGGYERDPETGQYPVREDDDPALAVALYIRTAVVRRALSQGQDVAVTASVRGADVKWRRIAEEFDNIQFLIRTVDPGRDVVVSRLADADDPDTLSEACRKAVDRWYRGRPRR